MAHEGVTKEMCVRENRPLIKYGEFREAADAVCKITNIKRFVK